MNQLIVNIQLINNIKKAMFSYAVSSSLKMYPRRLSRKYPGRKISTHMAGYQMPVQKVGYQ